MGSETGGGAGKVVVEHFAKFYTNIVVGVIGDLIKSLLNSASIFAL